MEEDANFILWYMASNGLVANAKKTSFVMLNCNETNPPLCLTIGGETVTREKTATLLGIKFDNDQHWESLIFGKGGVLSALNSRLYIIQRLKSHLSLKSITKVIDGLFTSKIRYGL